MSSESLAAPGDSAHIAMPRDELTLLESDAAPDPFRQFDTWLQQAIAGGEPMPNAMALATVSGTGVPSVRMVLLEAVDERGFTFQTNLVSPKARDLAATPRAAATFFWPTLVRQVRVSGAVDLLARDEVAASYAALPEPIQAMLRASHQSQVIPDRAALDRAFADAVASTDGGLPDHWGGYRLRPEWIEFWQGRENWLQDRLRYVRIDQSTAWRIERLVP